MNCREVLQHLYEYLDNELTDDVVEKINDHLEACKSCFDQYEFEKLLHKLIVKKGGVSVETEHLKSRVLNQIKGLESQDKSGGFFYRIRPYLAAAAAVIVVIIGSYFYLNMRDSTLYAGVNPFIDGHKECICGTAGGHRPLMTQDQIDSCLLEVITAPGVFLKPADDRSASYGFVATYGNCRAAHLIFQYCESEVSVYLISNKEFAPPQGLKTTQDGNHRYSYVSLDGLNVVFWKCTDVWCVAVSNLDVDNLITFASAY